jgi:hypothetical protein
MSNQTLTQTRVFAHGHSATRQQFRTPVKPQWRIPAALILLSAIPVAVGMFRTVQLVAGDVTPDNARFFASPVPVLLHIVSVTVYCVVGAFRFVPGLRGRRSGWHRLAGRFLVPCGLSRRRPACG